MFPFDVIFLNGFLNHFICHLQTTGFKSELKSSSAIAQCKAILENLELFRPLGKLPMIIFGA